MATSPESGPADPPAAGDAGEVEPLACTSCRSRKLKCDRHKPACTRCAKVGSDCLYPESRRKPAFKRRNVKELEERLAQVEGFLKTAGKNVSPKPVDDDLAGSSDSPPSTTEPKILSASDYRTFFSTHVADGSHPMFPSPKTQFSSNSQGSSPEGVSNASAGELQWLGRSESLPPQEMIEDLHRLFFDRHFSVVPIIHKARYLRSFYAAPHMRPPMCLQYAIWALGSHGDETYGRYHEVFYARARQYLEADELKGAGEHFISVAHAQAWGLIATNEARSMYFTRASMSSARCVRLVEMMGLHRLDDSSEDENPIAPTIAPPRDWIELEERRRVFWAAFCMDSHASISTGWPTMIEMSQVTTRLPCSEEAFNTGKEEKTTTLSSIFNGAEYSAFSGTIVTCHIFTQLLKHIHRPMPGDQPQDLEHGVFWKRHRKLDNTLSSAFMFLPERFRLPMHIRDTIAVHQNLNFHAAMICLHTAACEKVDKYKLPNHIKQASRIRCLTSAHEIINIMKMTSHSTASYKTPLISLALYVAASVFVVEAKENPATPEKENLEFILKCMRAIGRQHMITRAYFNHLLLDLEYNGVTTSHGSDPMDSVYNACGHGIPLLARSAISHHSPPKVPLPGRLPLGNPQGSIVNTPALCPGGSWTVRLNIEELTNEETGNKRKRPSLDGDNNSPTKGGKLADGSRRDAGMGAWPGVKLPHRSGTPAAAAAARSAATESVRFEVSESSQFVFEGTMPPMQPPVADLGSFDQGQLDLFQGVEQWDNLMDPDIFAQVANVMMQESGSSADGQEGVDQWTQLLGGDTTGTGDVWDLSG
ncbi:hypothetical protein OQA88_102 [Cercophora sp. LCS_1]